MGDDKKTSPAPQQGSSEPDRDVQPPEPRLVMEDRHYNSTRRREGIIDTPKDNG